MKFRILFLLAGLLNWPVFAEPENAAGWKLPVDTEKKLFHGILHCETPPVAGPFQTCLLELADQRGNPTKKAHIEISGGMPAHGHGLPTAPEVVAGDTPGTYLIKGLRFSMPGAWLVDMKIHVFNVVDQLSYDVHVSYAK